MLDVEKGVLNDEPGKACDAYVELGHVSLLEQRVRRA